MSKTTMNLRDGWGGGFYVVYYAEGKFRRLDEVAYAFYKLDISKPGLPIPISLIHTSYEAGYVAVRHLTAEGFQIYLIPEFNHKILSYEEDPNCIANEIISCVHIFDDSTHRDDLAVLFWDTNPDAEPAFYATRKDGKFGVQFRGEYIEKLNEAIKLFLS